MPCLTPLFDVPPIASVQDLVRHAARTHGGATALVDLRPTPISRVTFAELERAIAAFGAALREAGVRERDHLIIIGENRVQWGIAYLTAMCFNLVAVPIDRNLKENDILTIVHVSDARAVVFTEGFRDLFTGLRTTIKTLSVLVDMDATEERDGVLSMPAMMASHRIETSTIPAFPTLDPDALAALVFTSGSMGRAKGVMLSQANLANNLMAMLRMIHIRPDDRFLSVLPIHHTYECTCGMLCPLFAGATVLYARSLKTVSEDLLTARPTVLLGVPLLFEKMYKKIQAGVREKPLVAALLPALRTVVGGLESLGATQVRTKLFHRIHASFGGAIRIMIAGGAAMDPAIAAAFRSYGFTFIQGYGLTESSPILALNRLTCFKDDAVGLPLPNIELRIFEPDEEGNGEIIARGPSIMLGYYKNPDATAAVMRDGWLHTGDSGYLDADGFLHINGRKKNVIIAKNGKNVFPEELEDLVNRIPFVLECVVHGVRSAKGDEEIAVRIVPNAETFIAFSEKQKRPLTPELINDVLQLEIRSLNKKLPIWKQIRHVIVQEEEFEKTTTQKIKRYLVGTTGNS